MRGKEIFAVSKSISPWVYNPPLDTHSCTYLAFKGRGCLGNDGVIQFTSRRSRRQNPFSTQFFLFILHNQTEILTLNQKLFPRLASRPRLILLIRHKDESLAEASFRRGVSRILGVSESHRPGNKQKEGHLLRRRSRSLSCCTRRRRCGSWWDVVRIYDLAVVGLHIVARIWHLFREDVLDSGAVCDGISVEDNGRHGGRIEGG